MKRGQAFLSLVLLVGGAIILIGLTLAFLATSFIDTGYGYRALTQAQAAANSGVSDALLQLDRNASFSQPSGYSVIAGPNTATVTVTQNSPSTGLVTILSTATVGTRTRKITVVAAANASTSQVTVTSSGVTQ
jgi:hypothetical protein